MLVVKNKPFVGKDNMSNIETPPGLFANSYLSVV